MFCSPFSPELTTDCQTHRSTQILKPIDKHSKSIITNNIELLLNYCVRFYDRQFLTHENINTDISSKFENVLNDYFLSETPQNIGLPSVGYFADHLHLSPNYFGDLIKKELRKTAEEHIN